MLFPTHLVAGALVGTRVRLPMAWIVVGAALPDLIDKPLASVGAVELYHTIGHSVAFAVVLAPLAIPSRSGLAVAVGWASHLLLDALHVVVNGRSTDALFLLWPVAVPADPFNLAPIPFARQYLWTPSFLLEVGIWLVAGAAVVRYRRRRSERSYLDQ
jgi:hypothetical protein